MTKKEDKYPRLSIDEALRQATGFISSVSFACERIEIAGSLRRVLDSDWEQTSPPPTVGDIELVAIPLIIEEQRTGGLHQFFKSPEGTSLIPAKIVVNKLSRRLDRLATQGTFKFGKNGKKYKELIFTYPFKIDLFIANRDNWGLIFMIRTGSNEFSKNFMIKLNQEGKYTCKDGLLWELKTKKIVPVPDERDLFRIVGFDYIEPRNRRA